MGANKSGGRENGAKPLPAPGCAPPPRPEATSPLETVARLNATLDALPDLLFVLDRAGRIVDYHAPSPERLFVPPDQFLGRAMDAVLPEPARGIVNRAIADAWAHGHHRGSRYPLPAPDGERWFEISIAAQGDWRAPDGRLVAIVRDVTDRQRAEDALREREQTYRMLTEGMQDVIWILDVEARRFTYVSPSVEKLRGYTPEEILARPLEDAWAPEEHAKLEQFVRQSVAAFQAGQITAETYVTYEMLQPCKDGSVVTSEVVARLMRNERTGRLEAHGVTRNVSGRKHAENVLRESETRFAETARQSRTFVWEIDADGLFMFVTPVVEDVLGYRPDEIAGRLHFYDLHPADGREEFKASALAAARQGREFRNLENPMVTKDGRTIWVSTNALPVRGADGSLRGYRGSDMDVTARKQAEEALRESEARFAAATRASRSFVWEVDPEGLYTHVGDMIAEVLGYRPADLVGKVHFYDLLPPEGGKELKQACMDMMARRESPRGFENANVAKDGRLVWLSSSARPLFNPDGSFRGYQGIDTDVTARKQAEEALKASEIRYRGLIDFAVDGILLGSPDGVVTDANACMCALAGRSRRELIGKHVTELFDPQTMAENPMRFDLVHQGETVTRVRKLIRPDASEVFVEIHSKRMPDGTIQSIYHDITARQQADEALRRSEAKYRQLHETMRDAFATADLRGRILDFNPAFRKLTGYSAAELRNISYRRLTPRKWHAAEAKILKDQVLARGYSDVYEKEYRRKDGALVPVELRTILIRDAAGRPTGMWASIRDVTERKRAETALRQAHEELERRVRERTAELESSREALLQSEEQFRQMAENIQDAFWLIDARTQEVLYVSPAFERIWKQPATTDLSRWFAQIHPEDRTRVAHAFRHGMQTGIPATTTYRILWPDGSIRWIESFGIMIRDARGRPRRAAGLHRDVTEQRRLEAEILQAAEAERQRIGRDLHDSLGQSLTAIGYLADAVREDLARAKRPEADDVKKLGRLIGQTAAEAHALARGLLLADVKRGGLAAALQELAFRTQELFGVACRYSGPGPLPPLEAQTAGQLYRIAQEAATNAAKHGQVQRIEIRLAKERRGLLLSVRDSGRGLPARKKNAPGLGLDIMRYRAGLIGATLWIDSQPRRGTTVNCLLPRAAPTRKKKR